MRLQSAIFDMDGTLLDSMHIWNHLGADLLKQLGHTPRPDLEDRLKVLTLRQGAAYCKEAYGLPQTAEEIVQMLEGRVHDFYHNEVLAKPGVEKFLSLLKMEGVWMYVATATDRELAEAALRTAYFSHLYRIVHCQYTGRTQKVLLRALGEQIDLLNIIHVLRLKTYFPQTEPETYLRVLFPFHYRLNPDFTRALCAAPGVDDVFALLRDSPYRDCFDGVAVGAVEEYYQRAICRFNKRQLAAVPPSRAQIFAATRSEVGFWSRV